MAKKKPRKKPETKPAKPSRKKKSASKKKSPPAPPEPVIADPLAAAELLEEASQLSIEQATAPPTGDNRPEMPRVLPVVPIRGTCMFPGTIVPIGVGRPSSRKLLEEQLPKSKYIVLAAQRDEVEEEPGPDDLFKIATVASVLKVMQQNEEGVSIIVHGLQRVSLERFTQKEPYLIARLGNVREKSGRGKAFQAEFEQLMLEARELIDLSPNAPEEAQTVLMNIQDPGNLADFLAANLNLELNQKQALLECFDIKARLRMVHKHVATQLEMLHLQQKIQADVHNSIGDSQRRVFLREQLKAIQRELGEDEDGTQVVVDELREKLAAAAPPEAVMKEATKELDRLEMIPPASPEFALIMSYVELIAELPWQNASEDQLDLLHAREVLDRDHHGLDKIKKRILEFLAVRKLNPDARGTILCFAGPPGVGKTSLGQSIADALGRKFARIALGGIRDEAEVRGHRRTYIGAMPGRIIQELKRAGTHNPVIMLDEVDKLGSDYRGDPAAALLEVLDPRQNHAFVDRYLDVPFDLSKAMFICTANVMDAVPSALRDRLEVIELPGYTDHDKLEIAKRYLVPRQLKENGLKRANCAFRVTGLRKLIDDYTREAGVRELERQVGSVCRHVAAKVAANKNGKSKKKYIIDADFVVEALGAELYVRDLDTRTKLPGVVIGLAYTSVGGEVLFIEAAKHPGKGGLQLTGQIGDVMKESATAALTLFKSKAESLGYDVAKLAELDLHIHVPAGAVPKDGPSAGTAMFTAFTSLLLDRPVQPRLAMTGEITLRGRVLPIGGVKEKALAADRAGIRTILLPADNRRDLDEVDAKVRERVKFEFMETVDDVLQHALRLD